MKYAAMASMRNTFMSFSPIELNRMVNFLGRDAKGIRPELHHSKRENERIPEEHGEGLLADKYRP